MNALSRPVVARCTSNCSRHGAAGSSCAPSGTTNRSASVKSGAPAAAKPTVITIPEADRLVALDQGEPVEDAAAHIARALEGIGAPGEHRDRLLSGLKRGAQPVIFRVAEQAAADGRHADRRRVHIYK